VLLALPRRCATTLRLSGLLVRSMETSRGLLRTCVPSLLLLHRRLATYPLLPLLRSPPPGSFDWPLAIRPITIRDLLRPFALEFFCGSAGLSRSLRDLGWDCYGVDWGGNRLMPQTPAVVKVDLSTPKGEETARKLITHPRLVFVHVAPPCGTASRAMSIQLKGPCPKPLRDEDHPLGLPDLAERSQFDQLRVQVANGLYALVAALASALTSLEMLWTLENPRNSLFWVGALH